MEKQTDISKIMLKGIQMVFIAVGISQMDPIERKHLCELTGFEDEDLDLYLLGMISSSQFHTSGSQPAENDNKPE